MVAQQQSISGFRIFRRILDEQRDHWRQFVVILALSLLAAPFVLVPAFAMRIAVDCYLYDKPLPEFVQAVLPAAAQNSETSKLVVAITLLVTAAVLMQTLTFCKRLVQSRTKERLVLRFRLRLFPHVERLSLSYHDSKGAADSTFKVLFDTAVIPAVLIDGMIPLVASVLALIVMTTAIALVSWQLALVGLLAGPALLMISRPFGARLRKGWHEVKRLDTEAMSQLQEVLSAVRVIKAFGNEKQETERLAVLARQGMEAKVRVAPDAEPVWPADRVVRHVRPRRRAGRRAVDGQGRRDLSRRTGDGGRAAGATLHPAANDGRPGCQHAYPRSPAPSAH